MNGSEETIYDKIETRLYETVVERVKLSENILDVGCGDCHLVNILALKTKARVTGIDIDDWGFVNGLKEAEQMGVVDRIRYMKVDARFLSSSFSSLDKKFEAVVSVYALHEYEKPVRVLKEVNKTLKHSGKILLIDFIKGSTAEKLWSERYYTPKQIKELLKKARFTDIETEFPENKELVFIEARKNDK